MGASDVQKDQLAMYMQLAYYTAYWNNAKHPRKLVRVIKDIYKGQNSKKEKSDVDVEKFKERKRRFEEYGGYKQQSCKI